MRYFFVSFRIEFARSLSNGEVILRREKFPSRKEIMEAIDEKEPSILKGPTILSIFEFKSEQDYLDFIGESNGKEKT